MVKGQFAEKPNRSQSSQELVNSWTNQLAYCLAQNLK